MSDWASRRKAIYMWSVILVLTATSFFIFWKFWYQAPTCSDRLQNGDEEGIDCGGSCSLVCSAGAIAPILRSDPRIFTVFDNMYSVVAFVENRNINFKAPAVPYKFKIYDGRNNVIAEREGVTSINTSGVITFFEGNIIIANSVPKRAEIELPKNISWIKKTGDEPVIEVTNSPLLRQDTTPRIEATISNKSTIDVTNIELVAVVFDGKDNAIAASRTIVDRLNKNDSAGVFFTWPRAFDLGEVACETPSSVMIAIDRSGSMQSLSANPPEPLTSVKDAAAFFVSSFKPSDSAGLITFATEATTPPESALTKDFGLLQQSIQNVSILPTGTQYTNIADAIMKSRDALALSEEKTQKVLVLLTDGVATRPIPPQGAKNETEEIAYAEDAALKESVLAKQAGIIIYTIGLGNDVHTDFLRSISSSPSNFLEAPATSTLQTVYKTISSSICKEVPARIEVGYKIIN